MNGLITALRWLARLGSIGTLSFVLLMVVGDAQTTDQGPTTQEWTGLLFFPIGLCVGLLLAFFWERTGGLIGVCSFAGFYLWHVSQRGTPPEAPWFLILTSPALLWVIVSGLDEPVPQRTVVSDARPSD